MQFRRNILPLRTCILCALITIASCAVGQTAASLPGTPQTIPGLGTAAFPTSTHSGAAQTAFMRGLLLLHLFEYPDAAKAFTTAEQLDPGFALAYWGEAMTFNHGVWDQVDVAAGRDALNKFAPTAAARSARVPDPREHAYMAAVELLYDGSGTKTERDLRYSQAMQQLSSHYPNDRNAQLFYALALLSQSEAVRDVPVYLHAAAIAKAIYRLEPDNPGAAHYWIHGMDDPDHAAGALEAARALSKIAPAAPHALHMCSHIFIALGMWDDVVEANVAAIRVGNIEQKAEGFPPLNCGHYPEWLEYGYFQQGRLHTAHQVVAACQQNGAENAAWIKSHSGAAPYGEKDPAALLQGLANAFAVMQDMAVIESQDWTRPLTLDTSLVHPFIAAWNNFDLGYAAARRDDVSSAHLALQAMRKDIQAVRSQEEDLQTLAVGADELSGLIEFKEGHYDTGVAEIRHAMGAYRGMAFAFGPPTTLKPPAELLGDVLLQHGDAAPARQAFKLALERAPGRTESLLGLARAEHLAGDDSAAHATYQKLAALWHDADAAAPGVAEARKAASAPRSLPVSGSAR